MAVPASPRRYANRAPKASWWRPLRASVSGTMGAPGAGAGSAGAGSASPPPVGDAGAGDDGPAGMASGGGGGNSRLGAPGTTLGASAARAGAPAQPSASNRATRKSRLAPRDRTGIDAPVR